MAARIYSKVKCSSRVVRRWVGSEGSALLERKVASDCVCVGERGRYVIQRCIVVLKTLQDVYSEMGWIAQRFFNCGDVQQGSSIP